MVGYGQRPRTRSKTFEDLRRSTVGELHQGRSKNLDLHLQYLLTEGQILDQVDQIFDLKVLGGETSWSIPLIIE